MFTKKTIIRVLVYISGLCILALGLTLSTKADLGVSPIIAVSFCVSKLTGARFGDMTFLLYASFVAIEMVLHLIPGRRCPADRKKAILADVLQLPLSYVFTMLLNVLSSWIQAPDTMALRIAAMLASVILVGIGAALSLDMRLVANPGDGLVQAVSDRSGIELGLAKNIVDITCVTLTCILSMAVSHSIIGVGLGTLIAMLGIGRVIALVNRLSGKRLTLLVDPEQK
ncbi:MAG: hypothetical protein IJJ31_00020 [Mogibacterium sp.]|nr:hypothetical protein [Mogibacterium sp.]